MGNKSIITEKQVRTALETCPSHFIFHGRNPARNLDIGGGDMGIPGPIGPVKVHSLDGGRRDGTLKDVENLCKIYQASPVMTMNSNNGVEALDIPVETGHLEIMRAVLRHTDKPFYTKLFGYKTMHQAIDMTEIVVGETLEPGSNIYIAPGSCPSLSPMAYSSEVCENIIALAERGQFVTTGSATSTGVTGPYHEYGLLVMQNAELLAGVVLTQLVNPGNPVGYGTGAVTGNLRNATYCSGSHGRVFLQLGTLELGKRMYNLPARVLTFGTESVNMDVQCGIECYEGSMANMLAGGDYMLSEIGTLESLMTTSYEKTIVDEEVASRLLLLRNGMDISDMAASVETILRVGSCGTFLTELDTRKNCRKAWEPTYTQWDSGVKKRPVEELDYVLKRANAEWKKRLAEAPETMLDEGTEEALADYIKTHTK